MRSAFILLLLIFCLPAWANVLRGVRMHEAPDHTRVVLDTSETAKYELFTLSNPAWVVVDLSSTKPTSGFDPSLVGVGRERVKAVRGAQRQGEYRLVLELNNALSPNAFTLAPVAPHGHRLVIDLYGKQQPKQPS